MAGGEEHVHDVPCEISVPETATHAPHEQLR
ncbi:MAG: hypothetical protein K0R38_7385, partial [Polyangiaceae bacterium]|nr:hypothetical protein [Polyangiaceae bacterium]